MFFESSNGVEWSDWIPFSSDGSTSILFYLYNLCGTNDAYSYFDSDSVTAWVDGKEENRYYFVSEVEINGDSSIVSTEAPEEPTTDAPEGPTTDAPEEPTTDAPEVTTMVPAGSRNISYNSFLHFCCYT